MLFDYKAQLEGADIIHFNCGLWDMCDLFGDGPFTPLEVYVEQMVRIAKILKTYAPGGAVIFATTTPPSPKMWGHDMERVRAYNAAVMAALPATEIDGVSGHIKFDENGDAIRSFAYVKTVNNETGDWELLAVQSVE